MGGRFVDQRGYALLVGDSQAASQRFGFDGAGLRNVPKSKFMFYAKFHRARGNGGSDWERGVAFALKSVDRPKVSFQTETLNQYNRKRVIQTNHEFDAVMFKFHDTVMEDIQRMFEEYYQFYYSDPTAYSDVTVNDIVKGQQDPANPFGLKPTPTPDGFFSHITVYQVFNRSYSKFELINPKIEQYNPDDLDYGQNDTNEISMGIEFEGITYHGVQEITTALIKEMGLDATKFFDVSDTEQTMSGATTASLNIDSSGRSDPFNQAGNILQRQLLRGLAGEQFSLRSLGQDALDSFDKNRGLVTAKLGAKALGDLIKGNDSGALDAVRKLPLYGKPGKLF